MNNKRWKYKLKIADLLFLVDSFEDEYTKKTFCDYYTDEKENEQSIEVVCNLTEEKISVPKGQKLTQRDETNWYLIDKGVYSISFYDRDNDCISAVMTYDNENRKASVTLLDVKKLYGVDTTVFLYNVLERMFGISLVFNGGFAVHASSVVYDGYGLAFSAESGTGKSTHTDLWLKEYPGTYILNDDAPVFRKTDGIWYMYGSPWAGTTGINCNVKVCAKALVFLERSVYNTIRDCSSFEAIKRIFEAIINPVSDEITDIILDLVSSLLKEIKVCVLGCNISPEAPKTVKDFLF